MRGPIRRHPEWPVFAAAAIAWVALLAGALPGALPGGRHGGHDAARWVTPWWWMVMCVAMMLPIVAPAVRHVAVNSLRWRRRRAMAVFALGYLGVWAVPGLVLGPLFGLLSSRCVPPPVLIVGLALAAAAWQVAPGRRRWLRALHRTVPLPPTGSRADRGCLRFGVRHGAACVAVCGPIMAIMAVPGTHGPLWLLAVTAALVLSRLPRPARRRPLILDSALRAGVSRGD